MQKSTGDEYRKKTLNLSISGLKLVMLGLVIIHVFITITIYNSITSGLTQLSEFWFGVNLLVFAAIFGVYQYGIKKRKIINFQFH
jgi:hypothetical protein